jgi:Raf kinase inhibitor-like YbhB/YbcL family protein
MKHVTILILLILPLLMNAQATRTFTLKSNSLGGQASSEHVFNGFGCTGGNISPQLSWENPPEGTRSFALTIHDIDAPTGSGWWHWVVYDIPGGTTEIPAGAGSEGGQGMPQGAVQGRTDFGSTGYGGPCPPEGDLAHRYIITVFALPSERLDVPRDASPAMIGFNLNAQAIARASLIFYHGR